MSLFLRNPYFIIRLSESTGVPPIPVYEKKIVIGRGTNHVLAIPDASISRNHVEVVFRDGGILIMDLGTSNGTKIDGERIPTRTLYPYQENQVVILGTADVPIRFEIYRK